MRQRILFSLAISLMAPCAFAVDGIVLINQSTVMAGGGFPYVISQPGSYKLSGNLTQTRDGVDAIDINADNVVLDLNGFTITGPGASLSGTPGTCGSARVGAAQCNGIFSIRTNVTVKNGSIIGFASGLELDNVAEAVSDVTAISNGTGIDVDDGTILRCTAFGNLRSGIGLSAGRVSESRASYNTDRGVAAADAIITNNYAAFNGIGILAIHSLVGNNVLDRNGTTGATDLQLSDGAISQGNNLCTGGGC